MKKALIPVSKVPGNVLIDVLPLLHEPDTVTRAGKGGLPGMPASTFRRFVEECMHPAATGPGVKLTAIRERLATWGKATGRWTSALPTCRQIAALCRAGGMDLYPAHNNATAVLGWRLN